MSTVISQRDFVTIVKDTALASAPAVQMLGEMVDKLGEEFDMQGVEWFGEAIETIARMALDASNMARESQIEVIDQNGTRGGIKSQVLAVQTFRKVREKAVQKS